MFFSCLKSQEDVFDEPSATRLQKLIRAYKDTLAASENGWIMQYYPIPTMDYGGFNYWLKFDNDQTVSVYTNLNISDGTVKTSLYDIIPERGPMLTFNTYNDILHYFTTPLPSSQLYQGYKSDYEFAIEGYEDGIFTLKGKIYGNKMYLIRLGDTKKPEDYLNGISKSNSLLIRGDYICTTEKGTAMYFENSGWVNFRYLDGQDTVVISKPFALTDEGIDLNTPAEFNGHSLRRFRLDYSDGSYVCTDKGQDGIRFEYDHPDFYRKYDDLIGEYWCVCSTHIPTLEGTTEIRDSIKCTFYPTDGKKEFLVDSLVVVYHTVKNDDGETETKLSYPKIRLSYNPFLGSFSLSPQNFDKDTNLWILANANNSWMMNDNYFLTFTLEGNGTFNKNRDYSTADVMGTFEVETSSNPMKLRQAYSWRCLGENGTFIIKHWNKIK